MLIWAGCPLLLLVALTILCWLVPIDTTVCRLFYNEHDQSWPQDQWPLWRNLYHYGPLPALILGIAGINVAFLSLIVRPLRRYRIAGLYLGVVLLVGPGLLVNLCLKEQWGRPRPCQTVTFGGELAMIRPWEPSPYMLTNASFPCGHASMGFFLMTPAFVLYPRRKKIAAAFLVVGLAAGGIIGLARIAQGCHFPSDVMWSAGLIYLTGWLMWPFVRWADRMFWLGIAGESVYRRLTPEIADPITLPLQAPPQSRAA